MRCGCLRNGKIAELCQFCRLQVERCATLMVAAFHVTAVIVAAGTTLIDHGTVAIHNVHFARIGVGSSYGRKGLQRHRREDDGQPERGEDFEHGLHCLSKVRVYRQQRNIHEIRRRTSWYDTVSRIWFSSAHWNSPVTISGTRSFPCFLLDFIDLDEVHSAFVRIGL